MARKAERPASYAAYFWTSNDVNGATNALRFATEEEATEYAQALYQRWTAATKFEVRGTADPVNYEWSRDARNALPLKREA